VASVDRENASCRSLITCLFRLLSISHYCHPTHSDSHIRNNQELQLPHPGTPTHSAVTMSNDVAQSLACALINSRLDYCNALLYGAPKAALEKLQRIQNTAARVVSGQLDYLFLRLKKKVVNFPSAMIIVIVKDE